MLSFLSLAVALLLASVVSAQTPTSLTFSTVTSSPSFSPREYAACAQTPAVANSTIPTLYFFGGFLVTGSNLSYTDTYYNDAWQSVDFGTTWTQINSASAFPPQAWNSAIVTKLGLVYIGGGGDVNSLQNNQVYFSSNGGQTFSVSATSPGFDARENAGIAGTPLGNTIIIALGNTKNDYFVDDIWVSVDGQGASWSQACSGTSNPTCPLLNGGANNNETAQQHGPLLVGLYTGAFVLMGGYGSYPNSSGITSFVTNNVAWSTNNFQSWSTYTAPWSPRAQQRGVVDTDNIVYVYGGVYNLPSPTTPSQVYWKSAPPPHSLLSLPSPLPLPHSPPFSLYSCSYFSDVWYSTNAASSNPSWTQLGGSYALGSAGYPNSPWSGNPNAGSITSSLFTGGVVFNPCFAFGWVNGQKTLALYTGVLAGFRQQNPTVAPAWPGVYRAVVSVTTPKTGGAGMRAEVSVLVAVATVVIAALMVL